MVWQQWKRTSHLAKLVYAMLEAASVWGWSSHVVVGVPVGVMLPLQDEAAKAGVITIAMALVHEKAGAARHRAEASHNLVRMSSQYGKPHLPMDVRRVGASLCTPAGCRRMFTLECTPLHQGVLQMAKTVVAEARFTRNYYAGPLQELVDRTVARGTSVEVVMARELYKGLCIDLRSFMANSVVRIYSPPPLRRCSHPY